MLRFKPPWPTYSAGSMQAVGGERVAVAQLPVVLAEIQPVQTPPHPTHHILDMPPASPINEAADDSAATEAEVIAPISHVSQDTDEEDNNVGQPNHGDGAYEETAEEFQEMDDLNHDPGDEGAATVQIFAPTPLPSALARPLAGSAQAQTPPIAPPPVRLVSLVQHNGSLGYAWIDRAHTLVCGQTAPSELWMQGKSWGKSAGGINTGGHAHQAAQPSYAMRYYGLRKAKAAPASNPHPMQDVPDEARSEAAASTTASAGCDHLPKSLAADAHSSTLLEAAISVLVAIGMESISHNFCSPYEVGGEEQTEAPKLVPNPCPPTTVHIIFPAGALGNDQAFISKAVTDALRVLHQHITEQLTEHTSKSSAEAGLGYQDELLILVAPSYLPHFEIHFTPRLAFNSNSAKTNLSLLWPDVPQAAWACKIDLSCEATVLALSGACSHILGATCTATASGAQQTMAERVATAIRRQQGVQEDAASQQPVVTPFLVADVAQHPGSSHFLHIDTGTFDSLQVFRTDSHPAAIFSVGAAKEGLSLYFLLARKAVSPVGKELLRQWLAMPTCDPTVLNTRLEQVSFFAHFIVHGGMQVPGDASRGRAKATQIVDLVPHLNKLLRRVQHPDYLVNRLRLQRHSASDYKALLLAATALLDICKLLSPFAEICLSVKVLLAKCQPDAARRLIERISSTIDLEACDGDRARAPKGGDNGKNQRLLPSTSRATGAEAPILRHVSPQLDQLRDCYNSIDFDAFLAAAARKELDQLPPYYSNRYKVSVAFMPHMGYLAVVDMAMVLGGADGGEAEDRAFSPDAVDAGYDQPSGASNGAAPKDQSLVIPEGWEFVFQSADQCFCRTALTRELDTNIGDLHIAIKEISTGILRQLDEEVLALAHCLSATRHLAEIDACLALAKVAVEEGWTRPDLSDTSKPDTDAAAGELVHSSQGMHIVGGFHALLSRATPHPIIPFNLNLSHNYTLSQSEGSDQPFVASLTDDRRVVVLTGPHGSGKSVCQRAVGLIALLAHIGSYVPAAHAVVPLEMDRIVMIDASTPTTISMTSAHLAGGIGGRLGHTAAAAPSQSKGHTFSSAFGKELAAVCRMLNSVTNNSLVLVDEFGKGTLAADGVAILGAVLGQLGDSTPQRSMRSSNEPSPPPFPISAMAIFTTHYTEIFEEALVSPEFIAWKHMAVLVVAEEVEQGRGQSVSSCQQSGWGTESGYSCAMSMPAPHKKAARQLNFDGKGSEVNGPAHRNSRINCNVTLWSDPSPSRSMLPSVQGPSNALFNGAHWGSPPPLPNMNPQSPADTFNARMGTAFSPTSHFTNNNASPSSFSQHLMSNSRALSSRVAQSATKANRSRNQSARNSYYGQFQQSKSMPARSEYRSDRAQQLIQNTFLETGQRLVSPQGMRYLNYSPPAPVYGPFHHGDPDLASPSFARDGYGVDGNSPTTRSQFTFRSGDDSVAIGAAVSTIGDQLAANPRVIYLYELETCTLQKMFRSALETARVAGVPHVILSRAAQILEGLRSGELLANGSE